MHEQEYLHKQLFPHGCVLVSTPFSTYDVTYKINPWMHPEKNNVNKEKACSQWVELVNTLARLGAFTIKVKLPGCPDGVFSANSGLVYGDHFVLASFKHKERQPEEEYWLCWARTRKNSWNMFQRRFKFIHILNQHSFEGAGDALFAGDLLCCGYGFRTDYAAIDLIGKLLGVNTLPLKLSNKQFYHLDTCFCPLDDEKVMYYPGAFADHEQHEIESTFKTIRVSQADANNFACNSVILGKDVIIPTHCENTMRLLRNEGYTCHPIDMSEFIKAGGACKCLTLKF